MTTKTLTLTEFLLARIAEDEAVAREEGPVGWVTFRRPDGSMDHTALGTPTEEGWLVDGRLVRDDRAQVFYDPARVLAECEAKRRIVGRAQSAEDALANPGSLDDGSYFIRHANRGAWRLALADLALPYIDHPDYRPEWKP